MGQSKNPVARLGDFVIKLTEQGELAVRHNTKALRVEFSQQGTLFISTQRPMGANTDPANEKPALPEKAMLVKIIRPDKPEYIGHEGQIIDFEATAYDDYLILVNLIEGPTIMCHFSGVKVISTLSENLLNILR